MVQIIQADFSNTNHRSDYVRLLNDYARDEMGGDTALGAEVLDNLPDEIAQRDFISVYLAYDNKNAIGLITCMEGFSTFQCRPLLNIHDVYVVRDYRGQGISTKLLHAAQALAIDGECCKLTLEVLQGNDIAKIAYQNFGFKAYELNPDTGTALFWEKKLK